MGGVPFFCFFGSEGSLSHFSDQQAVGLWHFAFSAATTREQYTVQLLLSANTLLAQLTDRKGATKSQWQSYNWKAKAKAEQVKQQRPLHKMCRSDALVGIS